MRLCPSCLDFQNGADILFHGHFAENRRLPAADSRRRAGRAREWAGGATLVPSQHHAACTGGNQADNHVKAGGLTRAVGTEQADDFAAFDFQGKAFDDLAFF